MVAQSFAVVDGQEGKRYDRIVERSLVFSPDSQRVAYVARREYFSFPFGFSLGGDVVVVDGQEELR